MSLYCWFFFLPRQCFATFTKWWCISWLLNFEPQSCFCENSRAAIWQMYKGCIYSHCCVWGHSFLSGLVCCRCAGVAYEPYHLLYRFKIPSSTKQHALSFCRSLCCLFSLELLNNLENVSELLRLTWEIQNNGCLQETNSSTQELKLSFD